VEERRERIVCALPWRESWHVAAGDSVRALSVRIDGCGARDSGSTSTGRCRCLVLNMSLLDLRHFAAPSAERRKPARFQWRERGISERSSRHVTTVTQVHSTTWRSSCLSMYCRMKLTILIKNCGLSYEPSLDITWCISEIESERGGERKVIIWTIFVRHNFINCHTPLTCHLESSQPKES